MAKIALWSTLVLAAGLSGAAVASDDPMAGAYGNTVLVTNAKGETSKIWINKDGTYTAQGADGKQGTGKWALKDGKLGRQMIRSQVMRGDGSASVPPPALFQMFGQRFIIDSFVLSQVVFGLAASVVVIASEQVPTEPIHKADAPAAGGGT